MRLGFFSANPGKISLARSLRLRNIDHLDGAKIKTRSLVLCGRSPHA
jgi:hypothetical protein